MFPRHFESRATVRAPAELLFQRLDDPILLSAHMSERSGMMAGSAMSIELDSARGRAVGAVIRMTGRVLGVPLMLEEAVTERVPPSRKVWQTVGIPRLLVIGSYRMGFEIFPEGEGSRLRVFIDYALPGGLAGRLLGPMFARLYARLCTGRMARDAGQHFGGTAANRDKRRTT